MYKCEDNACESIIQPGYVGSTRNYTACECKEKPESDMWFVMLWQV